jgi:hypothetical protein
MQIGLNSEVCGGKGILMTQNDKKSAVMKAASSAATRTGNWSSAKQDFGHRVTTAPSKSEGALNTRNPSALHSSSRPSGKSGK